MECTSRTRSISTRKRLFAVLAAMWLLTGCADATVHCGINRNGSADLNLLLLTEPPIISLVTQTGIWSQVGSYLVQQGFVVEELNGEGQTGWRAERHFDQVGQLLDLLQLSQSTALAKPVLEHETGLWFDTYRLNLTVDFPALLTQRLTSWQVYLIQAATAESMLTLEVTLPLRPQEHNAKTVRDQGRTLAWEIKANQPTDLQLVIAYPSRLYFLTIGVATASTLAGLGYLICRRYRHK